MTDPHAPGQPRGPIVPPALRDLPPPILSPQFLKACNDLHDAIFEAARQLVAEQARIFAKLLADARTERTP